MHPEFPLAPDLIHLNHAGVAPWPHRAVEAVRRFAEENGTWGSRHYARWQETEQGLREALARLINAPSPDDIALVKNTSEALSLVAQGLPWQAGDNLVSIRQEFPSNRIPWEALGDQGVELRLLDLYASRTPEADLLALCDGQTRLISVSAVQYARGLRLDLNHLGAQCRARGILLCVDAIQQLGALPFDVRANQADFVAADGHKWLLGPEGLGLLYVRAEVREGLRLTQHGWHMVERMGDFSRQDWQPAASARRFECGSPNMLGIHALAASLSLIEETGLARISALILDHLERGIERVDQRGFELLSPRAPERRSGILCFRVPGRDGHALYQGLMRQGVLCALRDGGLRFSPHFHTDAEHLERAFGILERLLQRPD